jgi:hypothetical protein
MHREARIAASAKEAKYITVQSKRIGALLLSGFVICLTLARGDALAQARQEVEPDSAIAGGISPIAPSGWDQKDWDRRIVECKQINDLIFKRRPFTKEELATIPPISHDAVENCWGMESPFKTKELKTPASANPIKPVPVATPSVSPSSS